MYRSFQVRLPRNILKNLSIQKLPQRRSHQSFYLLNSQKKIIFISCFNFLTNINIYFKIFWVISISSIYVYIMYIITTVLKKSLRLLLWNSVQYTFWNQAVLPRHIYFICGFPSTPVDRRIDIFSFSGNQIVLPELLIRNHLILLYFADFTYRPFYKTLPRSSAFINRI